MPAPTRKRWVAFFATAAVLIATPLAVVGTHSFIDVPTSNVHHADISWLKDADVTRGCNPGQGNTRYCPDDPVTRAQMATFMRRLAQNKVVDAGKLNGKNPSSYQTVAAGQTDGTFFGSAVSSETTTNSLTISAPAPGVIVVSGSVYVRNESGSINIFGLRPSVNGTLLPGAAGNAAFIELFDGETTTLAYTATFAVPAGTHTVAQSVSALSIFTGAPVAGSFFFNANQLTAVWYPEGSVSLASSGSSETGSFAGNE